MTAESDLRLRALPSVDDVLRADAGALAIERYGRAAALAAVRRTLDAERATLHAGKALPSQRDALANAALARLAMDARSSLRPVFNLTGTVLHTNLGRALLADAAVEAAVAAMRSAVALEFDLADRQARRARRPRARTALRTLRCGRRNCRQQQRRGRACSPSTRWPRAAEPWCRAAN